jgi:hypothetical protein
VLWRKLVCVYSVSHKRNGPICTVNKTLHLPVFCTNGKRPMILICSSHTAWIGSIGAVSNRCRCRCAAPEFCDSIRPPHPTPHKSTRPKPRPKPDHPQPRRSTDLKSRSPVPSLHTSCSRLHAHPPTRSPRATRYVPRDQVASVCRLSSI